MLESATQPLAQAHDLVMFDLDGVVYISGRLVPGADTAIASTREAGAQVAFVTNNASRTPVTVAERLEGLGVPARPGDVVTSAQAAATLLARAHGARARVLVLGADGLIRALEDAGLVPVVPGEGESEDDVAAVVTGYGPDVQWKHLMRAATRIAGGLPWVASNTDHSLPTDYGIAPGHGVQVRMLSDFSGVRPEVAGKPARPLLDETVARMAAERPLMVGDRLDTDIEGAHAADLPSLLVLTGVSGLEEIVAATPQRRPTYLHPDLDGLHQPHPQVEVEGGSARCGGWRAVVERGRLQVAGEGSAADWWRVAAVAGWRHLDETGEPADVSGVRAPDQQEQ